ncbi:MAG TPA: FeoA family protein [bacterium]|nr:FeoA family protein [bacterium]HPR89243.1 FeoA family protein [bacterium]
MSARVQSAKNAAAAGALLLAELHTGACGRIAAIRGGWRLRQSLNQVGIHTGDAIQVMRGVHLGGPVLIRIHSMEIALGNGMAESILIDLAAVEEHA